MISVIRYQKGKQIRFWPKSIGLHYYCNLISNLNYAEYETERVSDYIVHILGCILILLGQKRLCLPFWYRITDIMLPIFFSKEAPESQDSKTV